MVPKVRGWAVGTQTTLASAGLQARAEWQPPWHLASSRFLLQEGSKDERLENSIHTNRVLWLPCRGCTEESQHVLYAEANFCKKLEKCQEKDCLRPLKAQENAALLRASLHLE